MIKSILAGFVIGIGGTIYLSCDNRYIGAFLFSIGLLLVLIYGFDLYTGKVPYMKIKRASVKRVTVALIGNTIGAFITGIIFSFTNLELSQKAAVICNRKLSEGWGVAVLAIMCNVLIFFAVDIWHKIEWSSVLRALMVVLCIMVFILCGFEHSIANIFYFSLGHVFNLDALLYLIANIIFNGIGGLMIHYAVSQYYKR